MGEPLMSERQTAAFLGVPAKTLTNWRYRQTGPVWLRVGRHIRYRMTDLESWLRTQERRERGD